MEESASPRRGCLEEKSTSIKVVLLYDTFFGASILLLYPDPYSSGELICISIGYLYTARKCGQTKILQVLADGHRADWRRSSPASAGEDQAITTTREIQAKAPHVVRPKCKCYKVYCTYQHSTAVVPFVTIIITPLLRHCMGQRHGNFHRLFRPTPVLSSD